MSEMAYVLSRTELLLVVNVTWPKKHCCNIQFYCIVDQKVDAGSKCGWNIGTEGDMDQEEVGEVDGTRIRQGCVSQHEQCGFRV